jgi:hypothetical protein
MKWCSRLAVRYAVVVDVHKGTVDEGSFDERAPALAARDDAAARRGLGRAIPVLRLCGGGATRETCAAISIAQMTEQWSRERTACRRGGAGARLGCRAAHGAHAREAICDRTVDLTTRSQLQVRPPVNL